MNTIHVSNSLNVKFILERSCVYTMEMGEPVVGDHMFSYSYNSYWEEIKSMSPSDTACSMDYH